MALQSNLQRRDTGYYFRVSVPLPLRPVIGKCEIIKSLRTKDVKQAKLRCQELSLHTLKWFDALSHGEYASLRKKHMAGGLKADDALYWSPLIALYTCMRIEEIAQLATDDIGQEGEIWFIRVTDEKPFQKLKTLSSKRKIPIHRELIKGLYFVSIPHAV